MSNARRQRTWAPFVGSRPGSFRADRAQAQAAAEQEAYRQKLAEREKRPGNRKGPKPPSEQPAPDQQINLTKAAMGLRQFLLRGLEKVNSEWQLLCLAYNVKRLFALKTG